MDKTDDIYQILELLSYVAMFVAGALVAVKFMRKLVISLRYGLQLSVRLKNKGLLATNIPAKRYLKTILSSAVLTIISILAILWIMPNFLNAFLLGLAIFILTFTHEEEIYNHSNFVDYVRSNSEYFTVDRESSPFAIFDCSNLRYTYESASDQLFVRSLGELVSNLLGS